MSNPKWRRKLKELVGDELAKFVPTWVKLEPMDVPNDFFPELEFYNWWLQVKECAKKGEFHPSLFNHPKSAIRGNDGNYKSVDLSGTGLPRIFARFYTKGLDCPHLPKNSLWPMKLWWPWFLVTLEDDRVTITQGLNPTLPLNSGRNRPGIHSYNPVESLCQMIADKPQQFQDSIKFWHQHYQTYLKLAPTERRFLSAIQGQYSRNNYGESHRWEGRTEAHWEPQRYLPDVDPTHYGRHLKKLESLGVIQLHRQGDGNITRFDWQFVESGAIIHICQIFCKKLLS